MIIDFHTHLFPPEVRDDRASYFEGEPAFELLYRPEKSRLVGAADLIESMDGAGVDKSVVFGFPWQSAEVFTRHNDYIIEKVREHPDRLMGLACFDVMHEAARDEAARCLDAGLAGLGELALYKSGIDDEALAALSPVMALAAQRDVPVMIHTNEPVGHMYPGKTPVTPGQVWRLLEAFPENRIVLAHWGGGIFFFRLLKKMADKVLANAWYDTAASPFLYDPAVYTAARDIVGEDRILFGTDYPLLPPSRYFAELDRTALSADTRRKILGDNAAALLGL